jgi:hypothetical protein
MTHDNGVIVMPTGVMSQFKPIRRRQRASFSHFRHQRKVLYHDV